MLSDISEHQKRCFEWSSDKSWSRNHISTKRRIVRVIKIHYHYKINLSCAEHSFTSLLVMKEKIQLWRVGISGEFSPRCSETISTTNTKKNPTKHQDLKTFPADFEGREAVSHRAFGSLALIFMKCTAKFVVKNSKNFCKYKICK